MIVVSDTGPLLYLTLIDVSQHLPRLYGDVYIPEAVFEELQHDESPAKEWISAPPDWLHVAIPKNLISAPSLDRGEREAISLALELNADILLVDERAGRSTATSMGVQVVGTLGVVVDAHHRQLIDGRKVLDELAKTNFYASPTLLALIRDKL